MKPSHTLLFGLILTWLIPHVFSQHEVKSLPITGHGPDPIAIEKINENTPTDVIWRSYHEIGRDEKTSDEFKVYQKIQILVVAHSYLTTHTRPEGVVSWNIKPPDGGMAGVAPESVKDPRLRAQYLKMIDENNAKAEAQNTYDAFVTLQNEIIRACIAQAKAKPENVKFVAEAIAKAANDAKQAESLRRMFTEMGIKHKK
jgi:hypothetical protein